MEVKVICPKCGESFSQPSEQVVRKTKCRSCSYEFVPAEENGVACPSCGAVMILPLGESKRRVACINCSFVFRKARWWRRRRTLILGAIAAPVLIVAVFVLIRWYSNVSLAKELRAEVEAWLQTIPKIPDSENGMLPVLSGVEAFKGSDSLPERLKAEDFSVENESDKTLLKRYLIEKEQALAQIYKGLSYKKFLCPGDYRKGYQRELPSLLGFKNAARTLELKGNLLESEGKKSEAFNEYLNIFRLGETLSNDHYPIPRMIEVTVLDTAFRRLTRILSERSVGEKDISAALHLLIELHGERGDFFTMVGGEYYGFLICIADVIEGKTDLFAVVTAHTFERPRPSVLARMVTSKYVYNYRYDVEIYRKAAEIWRRTDPAKYYALPPEARPGGGETFAKTIGMPTKGIRGIFVKITLPGFMCAETLAMYETLWRGAIALSAIRLFEAQNGRLPNTLTELGGLVPKELLTDPYSGKEIIYRLEGNDFYLYSVGVDGVDGMLGGALPYFKEKKSAYDQPDIIFHASAALKEK